MKKHFVIFIIVFALTILVPVIVCIITGSHTSNESVAGIFNNVKGAVENINYLP
ncbi:MAG: hypothetical protein J1E81_02740 [Eubacterium sp.]|nr:hypothetical protein [Eubacterium sp.]